MFKIELSIALSGYQVRNWWNPGLAAKMASPYNSVTFALLKLSFNNY